MSRFKAFEASILDRKLISGLKSEISDISPFLARHSISIGVIFDILFAFKHTSPGESFSGFKFKGNSWKKIVINLLILVLNYVIKRWKTTHSKVANALKILKMLNLLVFVRNGVFFTLVHRVLSARMSSIFAVHSFETTVDGSATIRNIFWKCFLVRMGLVSFGVSFFLSIHG
eukprot:TRINITY_DN2545_c0_g1_i2.p1 TRINITY_DN2545_c0_g1~~TRINITY_DN2545_c0_g1_i2.p1  ORF type:complete len:173 (+),score=8.47 TRINITY_DN2545_c0_g1_i2:129-647(+)